MRFVFGVEFMQKTFLKSKSISVQTLKYFHMKNLVIYLTAKSFGNNKKDLNDP